MKSKTWALALLLAFSLGTLGLAQTKPSAKPTPVATNKQIAKAPPAKLAACDTGKIWTDYSLPVLPIGNPAAEGYLTSLKGANRAESLLGLKKIVEKEVCNNSANWQPCAAISLRLGRTVFNNKGEQKTAYEIHKKAEETLRAFVEKALKFDLEKETISSFPTDVRLAQAIALGRQVSLYRGDVKERERWANRAAELHTLGSNFFSPKIGIPRPDLAAQIYRSLGNTEWEKIANEQAANLAAKLFQNGTGSCQPGSNEIANKARGFAKAAGINIEPKLNVQATLSRK